MGFNIVNLSIMVRTGDVFSLQSSLPLLGKEYSAVCRSLSCQRLKQICINCSEQEKCSWYIVFGQKLTSDPVALKRHQKPPLPFVFSFPKLEIGSGVLIEYECGLVVIGTAIPHIGMLLKAFAELLSDRFIPYTSEIIRVACRDFQGSINGSSDDHGIISSRDVDPDNLVITSTEGLMECRIWGCSDLHIRMLTPLRLLENGHSVTNFEFKIFARSVMRRVSSLAYYYGESEFCCDFKELVDQIDDVICTDNYFCFTNSRNRKLSGITGYGSFLGDFSCLMPFIIIGSYVHAGKNSSFGMGSYEVVTESVFSNL